MKKFLLALVLVLVLPLVLAGCSSAEKNARTEIEKRMNVLMESENGAAYTIDKCIYKADNDSCFVFSGKVIFPNGVEAEHEYLYKQGNDNLLIGLKLVMQYGSLLRNMNIKANTGSEIDNVVNETFASSGLGLSMTIYNDLKNGSLLDITDVDKSKSNQPSMSNESMTIKEIGTDSVEVIVR